MPETNPWKAPEWSPAGSVEDFITGMVNGFFENLDELVRLTPDEKADVEMVVRHHIVNALLKKLKPVSRETEVSRNASPSDTDAIE